MARRYCLTLDLKDDPELIAQYDEWHRAVWPEILASIRQSGIESMTIYRLENRLCMIMDVTDTFSFAAKSAADQADPKVQAWEQLMWDYQEPLPWAAPGEKWMLMEPIFTL